MNSPARWREKPNGEHESMNTGTPFVSVILPTYNRSHSIMRAVRSVLRQTYRNFELLVVDDGSSDDTAALFEKMDDDRLHYMQCTEHLGVAVARNTGIQASHGSLIAFQDSDDVWLPEKLALQIERMNRCGPDTGVVYSPFLRVRGTMFSEFPAPIARLQGDLSEPLLYGNLVSTQVALVRQECFGKVGLFDEHLPCLVDWELWLRISKVYKFACVDRILAQVYDTLRGISRDKYCLAQAMARVLEKHQASFQAQRKALAWQTYALGNLLCLSGGFEQGQDYLRTAVGLQPYRLRYRLATALTLLGERFYRQLYSFKSLGGCLD